MWQPVWLQRMIPQIVSCLSPFGPLLTQARDTSLPCSIKKSLKVRLDASKTFVLIVGGEYQEPDQGRLQVLPKLFGLWRLPQARGG